MSEHNPVLKNFFNSGYDLYLDEFYYISYAEQRKEMTKAEFQEKYKKYLHIQSWPETEYKHKALAGLHAEENPRYIKITGRMLLEWMEKGFVPSFDKYFAKTRRLVMIPIAAWDHYSKFSFMLRGKK